MAGKTSFQAIGVAGAIGLALAPCVRGATITVDAGTKYQKISGFGASTAWGSSMSAADADLLWSTTSGAGLSLHRIHIDPSNGSTSELPIAKLAVARNVTVWASPWTPPAADKSNNNNVMGTLTNPSAFATYLTGFVKKMKDNGVPIYAVSAQNEPDASVTYESCVYDGASMATWVGGTMGPAFAGTGVKVMGPETQNWCGLQKFWPVLKANANFMKYADIIATHEYGCSVTAYPDILAAGKEFWETEIYDTQGPADPGMGSGLRTAKLIHEAMTIASMSAWHFWWVYPGTNDNGALWDYNSKTPSKRMWVMGNYSRFVRPGFMRISATGTPASGVSISAYSSDKDGKLVIVAINTNSSATSQDFKVSGANPTAMTPWITDDSRSLVSGAAANVTGNAFSYSLPSKSVTTLVLDFKSTSVVGRSVAALTMARISTGFRIELPSAESGRAQLVGLDGRIVASVNFPAGTASLDLVSPATSEVVEARVVQGDRVSVSNLVVNR